MAVKKSKKTGRQVYSAATPRLRGRAWQGPRDMSYLKPAKFQDYLTLSEMAEFIPCDPSWLRWLERHDRIPRAHRVKRGQLSVRLWSPAQANEIREIISNHKVGRPPKD